MVNNADWLEKLGYVEFLREFGVHFTINRMLALEFVKLRLEREQPLTFLEFNYMLMQAADFLELNRRYGCTLQLGGSDQWGNIVNGVELIRRMDRRRGVRPDHAAAHHRVRREDGQDRRRRGLAQRRAAQPLRLLAVLAQHRGRRRRPLPEAVHRAAAGRDRPAGGAAAARRSTRPRRCWPTRPPTLLHGASGGRGRGGGGEGGVRGGPALRRPADRRDAARRVRGGRGAGRRRGRRRAGVVALRGAPARPGRRLAGQRRGRDRRPARADAGRPQRRRGGQARRRQEEDRARESRVCQGARATP